MVVDKFRKNLSSFYAQRGKSGTGIILNLSHTKIFKRNGTFETRLALKTKQNSFHHKMVNNKKIYFLNGMI